VYWSHLTVSVGPTDWLWLAEKFKRSLLARRNGPQGARCTDKTGGFPASALARALYLRLSSPAAAEGHVPAPSHGLHNATTQPARVRRGSTGLKVVDNSQVCANSLEFYIEANII